MNATAPTRSSASLRRALATLLLTALSACTLSHPNVANPGIVLPQTEERLMRSSADGREYRIFVGKPSEERPAAGFPVIYLLDGANNFSTMLEVQRVQSRRPDATGVTPAVVVGIGFPSDAPLDMARRTYEFTPSVAGSAPPGSGGADEFLRFIEEDLKPAIERDLAIDRRRQTLFGHSYGGLFVLHTLFTRPESFQTYVAASPSIWWQDRFILGEASQFLALARDRRAGQNLLVTVGQLEQPTESGPDGERADKLRQRRMVDNARDLTARLAAAGVPATFVEFSGENHGSTVPAAISRAVRFASHPQP